MGTRGPKKTPQRIQDLKGNPEKRPRLPDAVEADGDPEMPTWANVYAMEVFNKLVAAMPPKFFASVDTHILTQYANACALAKEAIETIQLEGLFVFNGQGTKIKHPAYAVWSDASAKLATLGTRLGFDPSARQSIVMPEPSNPEEKNNGFGDLIAFPGGKK